jgi:DNA-binding MarR family transcriptional regulator
MPPVVESSEVRLLLRRFANHRDRWIDALCRDVGVSRSDYDALEALEEHGSLTPGELGTVLSLTSGSVTALIDRLEDLGWASRNRHPDDRRKVIVTLTQKAWQIGQDELKPYLQAVDAAARQLGNDDRAVVVGFLEDLVDKVAHAPRPESEGKAPRHTVRPRQRRLGRYGSSGV